MVTYKILLDTRRPKSDGTYAVTIRITYDRRSTTFNSGVFVKEELWISERSLVGTNHPNAALLNKTITECYLKVQKAVIGLESENDFRFENLKEILNGQRSKPTTIKSYIFKLFADQLVTDMLSINQAGNAIVYRTTINRFINFGK
ncbi:Arm DNA-binding domain-containing protein [Mucilaginibacter sp. BT774]|uniref:Arm DNA-binding domain-containing protein n=1 Tax=Mucilaginibacter sp. BT774 TaxID=3062276 RepID=UPI00270D2491|nr:Arm DNA-binding domain-containing protein [Mucilaginibacter sp. BT774]